MERMTKAEFENMIEADISWLKGHKEHHVHVPPNIVDHIIGVLEASITNEYPEALEVEARIGRSTFGPER